MENSKYQNKSRIGNIGLAEEYKESTAQFVEATTSARMGDISQTRAKTFSAIYATIVELDFPNSICRDWVRWVKKSSVLNVGIPDSGKMHTVACRQEKENGVIYAQSAVWVLQRSKFPLSSFLYSTNLEVSLLNQKQIDAAAVILRIILSGLALNFDADFHELEEIIKRALLQIEQEDR
jgi:hypothetical protein